MAQECGSRIELHSSRFPSYPTNGISPEIVRESFVQFLV